MYNHYGNLKGYTRHIYANIQLNTSSNIFNLMAWLMNKTIIIKWEVQLLQELIDKLQELKKNNPLLFTNTTISIEVDTYKVEVN